MAGKALAGFAYMRRRTRTLYTALDDKSFNFYWEQKAVFQFDRLWREGVNIYDIARILDRDPDDVLILAIDRAKKKFIKKRNTPM